MLNYIKMNAVDVNEGILAHGCNIMGVMDAGIALAIREKWPQVFEQYKDVCEMFSETDEESELLGVVDMVRISEEPSLMVANCITHGGIGIGGIYADIFAVEMSLNKVVEYARVEGIDTIYMPKIGCGLGGLKWDEDVKPIVEEISENNSDLTINIIDI